MVKKYIDEGVEERMAFLLSKIEIPSAGGGLSYPLLTKTFCLGTDKYGRDILSRLIVGIRVSLGVGLVTVIISLSIGVLLGAGRIFSGENG